MGSYPRAYRAGTLLMVVTMLGALSAGGVSTLPLEPQQKPAGAGAPAGTEATWFFYKVRWGFQDEFLDLFQRNHYPVLKARMDAGYYASIRTFTPTNHGDGRADWTFAVELVRRTDPGGAPTEQEIVRKLYPDQAKFRKEEQRRFELLEAHWDVPLTAVDFEARSLSGR